VGEEHQEELLKKKRIIGLVLNLKIQEKRKEESKNSYISVGRGTSKIKFGDIDTASQRPSGKGMWVSSGRGTGKRFIK